MAKSFSKNDFMAAFITEPVTSDNQQENEQNAADQEDTGAKKTETVTNDYETESKFKQRLLERERAKRRTKRDARMQLLLPQELKRELQMIADDENTSVNNLINEVLTDFVDIKKGK